MENFSCAAQAPGVTTSMLEQMGMYSQQHKRYNSLFHQIKCKIIKKKSLASGYLSHSTFTTPPPFSTCLDPPPCDEWKHYEPHANSQLTTMQTHLQLNTWVKEHQLGCVLLCICSCLKRSFSFQKDAKVAGVHSLDSVSLLWHWSLDCFEFLGFF